MIDEGGDGCGVCSVNGLEECVGVSVLELGNFVIGFAIACKVPSVLGEFLGDSLAAGLGVEREDAFPSVIQKKLDQASVKDRVVNAGFSGDTTAGGLRRLAWGLKRKPDIFILELGGNDGLRGLSTVETEKNLRTTIDRVRKVNPQVQIILAGMQMPQNMGPEYRAAFEAIFPRVAKEKEVFLVPFLLEGVGGVAALNQADGIHPNVQGHQRVAENVWKVLAPLVIDAGSDYDSER